MSTGPFGVPTSPIMIDGSPLVPLTPLQQLNVPAQPASIASPADWYSDPTGGVFGQETPLAPARPNAVTPSDPSQSALGATGSGNPGFLQQAKNLLSGAASTVTDPIGSVAGFVFSARLIMLIIGIILIAAGVFSFKTTQVVAGKAAKAAGALAA